MSDSISRQDAIDALDEIESEVADGYGYQYEKWRKYFCGLPSAQPEIVRCKDCKLFGNSEQLPSAQPEPKWIPCRESNGNIHPYSELLHESKGILVTYKTRTGRRYVKQVLCNHGRVEKILLGDIVAWLPLPTPYREDEEE